LSVAAITTLLLLLLWRVPLQLGITLAAACTLFYATFSFYRGYLIYWALSHDLEVPISAEELARLDPASLPPYTVLVPLYREASVLPTLVAGLARLDYPPEKLDVKLLLEADDRETLAAVEANHLPPNLHPVIVPAAWPRGKPKACNYGLIHAMGEHVVIFDAEDVPEPDQLKKAVVAFGKVPPNVACLQAKLNYYNANQNLLTRWFTIEYSMWFDLFLPGLDASNAPIPLGGTSNHFRTACLLDVGAWDPFNVTEDADLGIRLYRRGWRTAVFDSTTYEEAASETYNWIRQRSRWVKGYIQTYLVHMRHPVQLWRAIGGRAFFSFNMVVGGTFFGFLVNPLLWLLTALWYLSHAHLIRAVFPGPVFYLGMCSLLLGNMAFIYMNVAGCMRPGMYDKTKYALFSPFYWALMSVAAWKGFLQLWTNPFYWEKTLHGQYRLPSTVPEPVPASPPVAPRIEVA
jgi:cellulose synthase/poly-beta-1,6-N-acetylglucosamine synthase-like glycosyltransferase